MNQTNGVSGSSKAIRSQPNSRTPQPVATRSAQDRQEEEFDMPLPKPIPVTTRDEANELLRNCQECVKEVRRAGIDLRQTLYQALVRGAPKLLGMSSQKFRLAVSSAVTNTIHRSYINRICLAATTEAALKLPFGKVNESALRTLRTKVLKDMWGEVLELALEEKGSYSKITAKDIVEAARELGYLKTPSDHPAEINNHGEAVRVWLQEYSKHQRALQRLLNKFDIQPAQIQKVVALVKRQRQQLDDLLSEIG